MLKTSTSFQEQHASPFLVPRLFLAQVGRAKVASGNQVCDLRFESQETLSNVHNGGQYDHNFGRRSPLNRPSGTLTGVYTPCKDASGAKCSCRYALAESDGISRALGIRTPFLFYRDYTGCLPGPKIELRHYEVEPDANCVKTSDCDCDCDCVTETPFGYGEDGCCGDCKPAGLCGRWLWAWGKVLSIESNANLDDYKSPHGVEHTFEFELEGPLTEVSWHTWGYGNPPETMNAKLSDLEAAAVYAEPKNAWWVPCKWSGCCSNGRFYPRIIESNTLSAKFTKETWDARISTVTGGHFARINVRGNYQPRLRMLVHGLTTLKIKNDYGYREYTFPMSATSTVFYDSHSGQSLIADANGVTTAYAGLCDMPVLEPGDNSVEVRGGKVHFGVTDQWIA